MERLSPLVVAPSCRLLKFAHEEACSLPTARPRTSLAHAAPESQVMVRDFSAKQDVAD